MEIADISLGVHHVSGQMRVAISLQVNKLCELIDIISYLTVTVSGDFGSFLCLYNFLLQLSDNELKLALFFNQFADILIFVANGLSSLLKALKNNLTFTLHIGGQLAVDSDL